MQLIGQHATRPPASTIMMTMKKQTGFTLIELMVILAVVSITAGFGVPQIARLIQNNRIVTQLNHLSGQLQYARSEAIRRGRNVNLKSVSGTTSWENGWTIYVDRNSNSVIDQNEPLLRIVTALNIVNFTITGPGPGVDVAYSSEGATGIAHRFTLTDDATSTSRIVDITAIGSIKLP